MRILSVKRLKKKLNNMRRETVTVTEADESAVREGKGNKIRKNLQETFCKEEVMQGQGAGHPSPSSVGRGRGRCLVGRCRVRSALASGAEKIGSTFRRMGSTIGGISQRLRFGSRRRQRLTECATPCHTPITPQARCRQVLGRTPTKLYSPFGIETPRYITETDQHFNPDTPEHMVSPRKKRKSTVSWKFMKRRPRSLFH